jgi:ABC-type lipoprotein export system ATPase subunit
MTPALSIRDLTFEYSQPQGGFSLTLPSLELQPGQQLLLTAPSGKGKSTLLALIAGLMEPRSGSVTIAGTNIFSLSGAARDAFRGRNLGMIFQTLNLLRGFTALENVAAALYFAQTPSGSRERSLALLSGLGISTPDAPVENLSLGQQQRVAIARAVACKPALVLADEPTASLDPENSGIAMDLIQSACKESGAALLCVSHDPAMASRFSLRQSL